MVFRTRLKENLIYIIGLAFVLLIGVIYIFTNVGYDSEYQIAMGYRMIKGDRMIVDMWEPHQTSAFLVAFLEWVFIKITGSTTGIVLYLQIVSTIIRGLIALALFKCLKEIIGKNISFIMAYLFFTILPKDITLAEFSNMQVWFGALLFVCLVRYYQTKSNIWIVLSAVSLCLQVLSYPSCLIVAVPVAIMISAHEKKAVQSVLFIGICALIGIAFSTYFLISVGWKEIAETVVLALSVEPTHTVSPIVKLLNYVIDFAKLFAIGAVAVLIAVLVDAFLRLIKKEKKIDRDRVVFLSFFTLLIYYFVIILSAENRHNGSIIYIFVMVFGLLKRKLLKQNEICIYDTGMSVGLVSMLATLILADNPGRTSVPYALVAICISFLPIFRYVEGLNGKKKKGYYLSLIALIILFFFKTVYIRVPISGRGQIMAITEEMSIIRNGPAKGIITNTDGACRQRDSYDEWNEFVSDGANILLIGGDVVDTLGYLYSNTNVATPSVMSTPTYNDSLLDYWEKNPDKYPDVVIVSSYMGELDWSVRANKWVWNWLGNQYESKEIKKGTWWTYYYR